MKKNYQTFVFAIKQQTFLIPVALTIFSFFLSAGTLQAQIDVNVQTQTNVNVNLGQVIVKGVVQSANGEGLAAASIIDKKSNASTVSDNNGAFSISVPADAILTISHVGYKDQDIAVGGRSALSIVLDAAPNTLNDVVVVGYTAQKKSSITGAIGTVNMEDADKRKVPDVAQMLQGQVAGVQVTQSTGAPGDPIQVVIRGSGTIFSGNDPLYIVDGVPTTDISFINPTDIASMSVLKDAASAALYGARASGGVVVVTTKSGRKGKAVVNVDYYHGLQQVTNLPQMLNGTQYMDKMEESWNNANPGNASANPYTADKNNPNLKLANTNWLDELFTIGQTDNVNVSVSGGSDKVQFFVAGGYYHQNGIVVYDNDQYNRVSFRTNLTINITDRLKVGTNLQVVNAVQDALSSSGDAPGIIRHAFIRPPVIGVYKDPTDPTYSAADPFTDLPFYAQNLANSNNGKWDAGSNHYEFSSNPVALAYYTNDKRGNLRSFGNVFGEYAFLKNKELKFRSSLGFDADFIHNKAFYPNFGDDDGGGGIYNGQGRINRPNSLSETRGLQTNITWTNTLNYNKKIGKNYLSALLGTEYISDDYSFISGSRVSYSNPDAAYQYLGFGSTSTGIYNDGTEEESALFSVFGGVNYNYDSRYYLSANLRRDASSKFTSEHQVAYFPSFSGAWRISQESFMKNSKAVSDLKLRASWGQLGNQNGLSNYTSYPIVDPVTNAITRLSNPNLKWETTTQTDVGLDMGFVQNKLTASFDYFRKKTTDLILPLQVPIHLGNYNATAINAGEVSNNGYEITVGYRNNDHAFKYAISANYANVQNEVNAMYTYVPNIFNDPVRTEAGQPVFSYYGYKMVGIYQNQSEIDTYLHGAPHDNIKPGYIKFADLNNDGVINDKDRTYIGNPNPRNTYGLNLSGSYKAFDFSIFFQGVQGVERWNDLKRIIDYDTRPFNHSVNTLNAWDGEGTSNTVPISTFNDNGSSKNSSIFVEDASYLRLKNVEIGYSFGKSLSKYRNRIQDIRIYLSMQNLFTITDYTGLDPEQTLLIDKGTYPQSQAFILGVNVKF
ncbi:SusC/RagA family TonB-linked outer membrane protein [Ferruginibacter albus]|uniref:SusC/RagA family TonB-linked outer membrane protein n=1 Tax=Ferruginibacter albus TaxID=2875540 RepID=UPI001CC6E857|nr:TonB-dependent receptor [Ferruginibacter albus]UAY53610.1 TonB-dependent receptor [Ferruginibacter albus]